jgi:6-pyruvoyl-tetrahydropterin synthase
MDLNCKPIHAHAYTVPISVEQQLQPSKEIAKLVDIEEKILELEHSSQWASRIPTFTIPKKNGTI